LGDPLRVLLVEDVEDDLLLVLRQLRQAGYEPQYRRVETAEQLHEALVNGAWQIVISDWQLPTFDGLEALRIVREHDPDLPFVIVSGTVGEEAAVQAMRAGAQDCVMKGRLARLGPAVTRELGEAIVRQQTRVAESQLLQSEHRFRALIENALDLIAVLDREGVVKFISPASRQILGFAPEELLGQTIAAWIHPDDLAVLESDAVGKLGGLVDGETITVRFRHAAGHWTWIEAIGLDRTDDPAVGGVVINARDVTQRRADELAMARLFEAVQQTREAIVITDITGKIEYVNPAFEEITGYSAGEAMFQNPRILKSGRHPQSFYETMWDTLLSGRTWSGRLTNRRRDGTLYEEEATITPVLDRDGEILHFVAVKRDITATLALEAQLLQAQKMEAVGRLAGGIAHDFNNLLMLLVNHAQFLKDSLGCDAPQQADVDGILAAADRATSLTRQLLTFSRRELAQPEVVDLNRIITNVERLLRHTIGEDVIVLCDLAPELPPIQADPGKLEQVLMNLAINARDAMPRGGTLWITTSAAAGRLAAGDADYLPPGDYVSLTVRGHRPRDGARRGDSRVRALLHHQAAGQRDRLGAQHGLRHRDPGGGGVAVYSEVGQGAEFAIYLPASDETAPRPTLPAPSAWPRGGGETILVVEDEATVRSLTSRILEVSGYTVHSVANGPDGLEFERGFEGRIDLLLTDVVMPNMSGVEFAQAFTASRPGVPVIFMSGYTADIVEAHGLANGPPLLHKPFTASQLVRQVQASLAAARKDSAEAS